MGPTGTSRVVQIHPTRQCNLRCKHCYSSSAPEERGMLDAALLRHALTDATSEGYTVASMSGGEPLLYGPLREVLAHARSCGLRTAVTTNGMLLDERRLGMLEGVVDLVAISLDGVPASHNRIRGSRRAFEKMTSRLEGLRASGIPFGFIFTLTQYNLDELDWVAGFAHEQGARLLQIHPLEEVGRAAEALRGEEPDGLEASFAMLEAMRVQRTVGDDLFVQVDLVNRAAMQEAPGRVYADEPAPPDAPLAQVVSPLVVEADGTVVPLQYGFARRFALGNLHRARLRRLAGTWKREVLPSFRALCSQVYAEALGEHEAPFFNWYGRVTRRSAETTVPTL